METYNRDVSHYHEHIQHGAAPGSYGQRLYQWAESEVRITIPPLPALSNTHARKKPSCAHHLHSQFELLPYGRRCRDSPVSVEKKKKKKKHFIVYSTQIWNFEPLGKDKALIGAPFYVITPSVFVIKKLFSWCYLPSHLHFWISCAVKIECNWMRTEGNLTLCTLKPHLTHAP